MGSNVSHGPIAGPSEAWSTQMKSELTQALASAKLKNAELAEATSELGELAFKLIVFQFCFEYTSSDSVKFTHGLFWGRRPTRNCTRCGGFQAVGPFELHTMDVFHQKYV